MKKVLLVLIIFSFSISFAQRPQGKGGERPKIGIISGKVIDENKQAVEFATISLISMRTQKPVDGGITNSHGYFELTKIEVGKYKVIISFIGFHDKIIDNIFIKPNASTINLGKIKIEPNAEQLETVEVVAEKNLQQNTLEKKVFNVSKDLTSETSSVTEVLNNLPSVDIDMDGNVTLRGNSNVRVLIDGRPSSIMGGDLATILEQFPANTVESIEVITNPSAKYDADGMAGIINIKLKKEKRKGTNGSVLLTAGTGNKYNGSLKLNHRTGKFNFFGTYSYRYNDRNFNKDALRQNILTDTTTWLKQTEGGNHISNSNMFNAGIDYFITNKISLSYTGNYSVGSRDKTTGIEYYYLNENEYVNNSTLRATQYDNERTSFDNNLVFTSEFAKPGQELSVNLTYSKSNSDGFGSYTEDYYDEYYNPIDSLYKQRDYSQYDNTNIIVQADYVQPLNNKAKIETGYKSIIEDIYSNYQNDFYDENGGYYRDTISSNDFDYKQQIHAAYGIYSGEYKKLKYQGGLRFEYAQTSFDIKNDANDYKNTYQNIFPSLHLAYGFTEQSEFTMSYSRRVNRPSMRSLSPIVNYSDPYNIKVGNPYLNPEYINSMEVGYSHKFKKFSVLGSVYYKIIEDVIKRYKSVDDSTGIALITYQNLTSGTNYGVELVVDLKLVKWMKINLSTNFFRTIIDGSDVEGDLSNDALGSSNKLMAQFRLPKGFSAQLSGMFRTPITVPQGSIDAMYWSDVSVKKKILKGKGTLGLRLSDIFNTRKFNINISDYNFTQEMQYKRDSRVLYFSFSYNFGKQFNDMPRKKRPNKNRRDSGGDDIGL